jgi:hypothetical protein
MKRDRCTLIRFVRFSYVYDPGEQIRAARKLLDWTQDRLTRRPKIVTAYTVLKAEDGAPGSPPTDVQWKAMRDAVEAPGVEFTNGDAPGVRLGSKRRL